MEFYKIINEELLKKYGKDIAGRPMYRIVQNERSYTEKRKGNISTYAGSIFIREEFGVHEIPKYNYVPEGFWILEQLFNTTNPELTTNYSYEPVWVFRDPKTDKYQAPNLRACIFLIEASRKGPTPMESEEEKGNKEQQMFYEMLGGDPGPAEKIASQEGVSFSGLDAKSLLKES